MAVAYNVEQVLSSCKAASQTKLKLLLLNALLQPNISTRRYVTRPVFADETFVWNKPN